jgi:hypothetical protein
MFYKVIEGADSAELGSYIVAETAWYIVIWCLIEAFLIEGLYRFLIVSISKTVSLFYDLGMDTIASLMRWLLDPVYWFHFLGSGGLFDWVGRGLILWACTGLPLIVYRTCR